MSVRDRPLSPHLQIYRPMLTTVMSITHRITGCALYLGMPLLAWWLMAAASGPDAFAVAQRFMGSWLGLAILFALTWALSHHLLGGLRHLLWDSGRGFEKPVLEWLARATITGSLLCTAVIWIAGWFLG
ncbi:MAG: succinate dehydrogenase, cytochrome b556 subunit [Hyphomicrobiales bacterium]